jgi:hypothetical protein
MKNYLCILALGYMLLSVSTDAAVYFIDYTAGSDTQTGLSKKAAWKLCPGMTGFKGSYKGQLSDTFVFKGGSVWPSSVLPLVIKAHSKRFMQAIYTADKTWFSGSFWVMPVFNGEHKEKPFVFAENQSFFALNSLMFIDFGTAGKENGGKSIDISGCSDYAITNCIIAPQAWIGLYLHSYTGFSEENIRIENNDISAAGQAIVIATEAKNTRLKKVTINNNRIHDLTYQIVGETHGDGIHTWNSPGEDLTQYISDLVISNNKFYGDFSRMGNGTAAMTSLIYLTDPGKRAEIYGNELTYSKTTSFSSLIWIRYFDSVAIYNNTLVADPSVGGIGIIVGQGAPGKTAIIKNNIIAHTRYSYYIYEDAIGTIQFDNNACFPTGQTVAYWNLVGQSWREWQHLGNDVNGIFADPQIKAGIGFALKSSSPCIGKAAETSSLNFVKGSPAIRRLDIGAYQTKGNSY